MCRPILIVLFIAAVVLVLITAAASLAGREMPTSPTLTLEDQNSEHNLRIDFSVPAGVDLWETPNDSASVDSLFHSVSPLPPDFFGPGSDPFDGIIYFEGFPLQTTPPGILGPTDAIIQRLLPATLNDIPSADTVPIQIIALSLISTDPITVTYDGGMNPEPWDVRLCLSSVREQMLGEMHIVRHCDTGGSFYAELPVTSKLVFTRISDGLISILDPYRVNVPWYFEDGRWAANVPSPFTVYTSPGGVTVDHDCAPVTPQITVARSGGDFYPGWTLGPCDEGDPGPPICGGKHLTLASEVAASHRMLPPQSSSPVEGACCLEDGRCLRTTPECCLLLRGDYQGDLTTCWPHPCTTCCNIDGIRGDADNDCTFGCVNVADLSYLVAYLFQSGPAPVCEQEADADSDCTFGCVNVADLSFLVAFLFQSGPAPGPCP